jgi:hypothetical protein
MYYVQLYHVSLVGQVGLSISHKRPRFNAYCQKPTTLLQVFSPTDYYSPFIGKRQAAFSGSKRNPLRCGDAAEGACVYTERALWIEEGFLHGVGSGGFEPPTSRIRSNVPKSYIIQGRGCEKSLTDEGLWRVVTLLPNVMFSGRRVSLLARALYAELLRPLAWNCRQSPRSGAIVVKRV